VYRDSHGDVSHVGIVNRKNLFDPQNQRDPLEVLSKWGAEGEYFHDMNDVHSWLGKPAEYWTEMRL
jgi:hypothetical protein